MERAKLNKFSSRVAEEAKLLAEEKWILETLAKIRIQRNCLQIERLEMENMRAKLIKEINAKKQKEQNGEGAVEPVEEPPNQAPQPQPEEFDIDKYLKDIETMCNAEQLDLNVTAPIYNNHVNTDLEMEDEESEMEEMDDDCDVIVDMNMLMNGQT